MLCIKVDVAQHSTDIGRSPKYNKSILEILNDNIYFGEKTQEWYIDYCFHFDNKHEVRTYQRPIANILSVWMIWLHNQCKKLLRQIRMIIANIKKCQLDLIHLNKLFYI